MKSESVILDSITKLTKGKKHLETAEKSAFRYLQIEDIHGTGSNKFTNEAGVYCKETDLLIAWDGANAGKVGTGLRGMAGSTLARISITSDSVNSKYLFWFLNSKFDEIKSKRTGATIPHVNGTALRTMSVPLPPLFIQQQIADALDKADALRKKDQELLAKYDELAQALFYEMFGDIEKNSKKFPIKNMGEVVKFTGGSQPPKSSFVYEQQSGYIRLIQIRDYRTDKYPTYIPQNLGRRFCNEQDIMIGRYGPPVFQILRGISGAYNVALMKATPNTELLNEYLFFLLSSSYVQTIIVSNSQRTAGQSGVNLELLESINIPIPPLLLQEDFNDKIIKIKKLSSLAQNQEKTSTQLFETLLNKYFQML